MNAALELVANTPCRCGENPLWHPEEACLYWIDIPPGQLHRWSPATGTTECLHDAGQMLGALTLEADGALLLFLENGAILRRAPGGEITTVAAAETSDVWWRFNDALALPDGSVLAGEVRKGFTDGGLLRFWPGGQRKRVCGGIGCSNGMGLSPDGRKLYYTDSNPPRIQVFDRDPATGALDGPQPFIGFPPKGGVPDGLTVDRDGCLWSAMWEGGCVVRYDSCGQEMGRLPVPARKVTSVAFGGAEGNDLFITTAGGDARASAEDLAGSLFVARGDFAGRPEFRSRLGPTPKDS